MITRQFDLFLNKGVAIAPTINVNQYDHNEQWVFTLYQENGSVYTPLNGAIAGVKSDKKGIINSASVNSDGQVVVVETEQMTAAAGTAIYELVIDDGTHGTANFIVQVEPKPTDGAELSDSDYSYIQDSIDRIAEVTAEVKSVVPVNIGTDGQVLTKRNEQSRWETYESLPGGGTDGQVLTRTGGGTSSSWQTVDTIPSGGSVGQVLTKTVSGPGWRSVDEVPSNGTNGQVLTKTSTGYGWDNIDALPSGGTSGQVLTKNSSTDGDASWRDQVGTVSSVNGITPDTNKNVQVDVELTQAQYDALPASKMSDNVNYFITDGLNHTTGVVSAENVIYDNTSSGMTATNVQGAVDELNNGLTDIFPNHGTYETIGSANTTFTVERTGLYLAYATSASSSTIMQLALYDNTTVRNVAVLFASNGAASAQLCYLEIGHTYRVLTRTNVGQAYLYS